MSKTIINQKNNLQEVNATINDQLSFINNIIENSPYGIFVLNNKSMIFENSASSIFSNEKNTSFENFTKLLSNHFNNSQNFYKKSYEINLEVKLKIFKSIFL